MSTSPLVILDAGLALSLRMLDLLVVELSMVALSLVVANPTA